MEGIFGQAPWQRREAIHVCFGAGSRDRLGNTAAHVIPLYADDITLQLAEVLAGDKAYLKKKIPGQYEGSFGFVFS